MKTGLLKSRLLRYSAVITAAAIFVLPAGTSSYVQAAARTEAAQPKIVQATADPLALDDQGNVWGRALQSISVKEGFHRTLLMKGKGLDKVKSVASGNSMAVALREDRTVWVIEREDPTLTKEQVYVSLGDQVPGLHGIQKVILHGTLGLAVDQEGKVWMFESASRRFRNSIPLMKAQQLRGLDSIKDLAFGSTGVSFLREDGTVWIIDYPKSQYGFTMNENLILASTAKQIKELKGIVKLDTDSALSKDGTVWVWGTGMVATKQKNSFDTAVSPYQLPGLSEVTDLDNGGKHALFVKKDGSVWGLGYFTLRMGALGGEHPDEWKELFPVEGLSDVVSVSVNDDRHGVDADTAVKKDGTLWMWGIDTSATFHPKPLQVDFRTK
ncbi:RCC1 domain-containing protein [Paenibacillus caseinilyticus]|uniref:Uncharacterized protein n=1 Tax=Paenibacillus mucilaginosus K02 TaxID=997761 RepID=I0BH95_9BACL|nr:hypothetical protein [Paenibacillus mucilaginosus]AFH61742.2 hypothetical protein B2K_13610 [Paenibacillus mucilaginosus K02]